MIFCNASMLRLRISRAKRALAVDLLSVDAHEHLALEFDGRDARLHGVALGLERLDALREPRAEPLGLGPERSVLAKLDLDLRRSSRGRLLGKQATHGRETPQDPLRHGTGEAGRRADGSPKPRGCPINCGG